MTRQKRRAAPLLVSIRTKWSGMTLESCTSMRAPDSETSETTQLCRCSAVSAIQAVYRKGCRRAWRFSLIILPRCRRIEQARLAIHNPLTLGLVQRGTIAGGHYQFIKCYLMPIL